MFRLTVLGVTFLLSALIAAVSSLADDRPVPPADPKSQEECRAYQRRQIDYAHTAVQKSRECSARNRATNNQDIVLYLPSCGGHELSAFRSCSELSDAAWCALTGVTEKMNACLEKASAAEQSRLTDALAQNEKQKKIDTKYLQQGRDAVAESGTDDLQKSLQQERERASRLEQDLALAPRDVETQTALTAKANDEASKLKAAESSAAELRKSLLREQERAGRIESDLAAARRDIETQTSLAAKASSAASQLKEAADQGCAELKRSLQKEHERAEALANELSMAHAAIYAYEAQAHDASGQAGADSKQAAENGAAELRKSLQQEQERGARLEQDLGAARHEVDVQALLAAKAGAEAARLKQAADDSSAETVRLLQQEREKTSRLERELASERKTKKAVPAVSGAMTTGQVAQDKQPGADATRPVAVSQTAAAAARSNAKPDPEKAVETARLVARASMLLGQGDIGSARIVLERAAETGNAQANFALAETYDPLVLRKWGVYGTLGDAAKARDLYARAQAGGIKEARERFDALRP